MSGINELSASVPVSDSPRDPLVYDDVSGSVAELIANYWRAAVRNKWWIIGLISIALTVGIVYTLLQPNAYSASSRIEISRSVKNITNVQGIDQAVDPYDTEFYDTQYALLRSPSLAQRVVRKYNLDSDLGFFMAHGQSLPKAQPGQSAQDLRKVREQAAESLLLSGISIKPVRNSSLVDISYESQSPDWSAKIANVWPTEFISANMDRKLAATIDARNMLEDRLGTLRAKLEESENRLIGFANSHNIIVLSSVRGSDGKTTESRSLVASNLEVMNTALMQARADRIVAESKAHTGGDSSIEVQQSSTIGSLRSKRAELAAEYARLMVQFEPGYPAAVAVKSQIDTLDHAIALEAGRVGTGRKITYAEAVRRENALGADVDKLKAQYREQQQNTIQYNIYQREVDTNRQLYDGLLQRYKEIGVAATVDPSNVLIVDEAKVPGGPSSPSLPRNLAIALLLGLAAAGALVFLREQMDDAIRGPDDIEQKLRLPLLGVIPKASDDASSELQNPHSKLLEAYYSVRASLALATPQGFPKSLVTVSTQPGEGKSTTALALAMILARTGKRVLVIDADMRSPSIHELVGVANEFGLSNLLSGSDDYAHLIVASSVNGVSILPAGPMPPSAAQLLSSERLVTVLRRLEKDYDHLIIDSPPVMGLADAPLLKSAVEGCVFVIASTETSLAHARRALARIQQTRGQVFGAVATKVDGRKLGYGSYYDRALSYGSDR